MGNLVPPIGRYWVLRPARTFREDLAFMKRPLAKHTAQPMELAASAAAGLPRISGSLFVYSCRCRTRPLWDARGGCVQLCRCILPPGCGYLAPRYPPAAANPLRAPLWKRFALQRCNTEGLQKLCSSSSVSTLFSRVPRPRPPWLRTQVSSNGFHISIAYMTNQKGDTTIRLVKGT